MWIAARATAGRLVALPATLLAAAVLTSGCSHEPGLAGPNPSPALSGSTISDEALAWPLGAVTPTATASQAPVPSRTPGAAPTRRPASTSPRAPLTLTLTEPLPPFEGDRITAIYQDRCGDPTRALVYVEVADPANISSVWYEYHVATPVPFNGVNHGPTVLNDFKVWRGMIGPFEANPSNANGGPITVTAHGIYRDGTERTVTATWTLKPCHR